MTQITIKNKIKSIGGIQEDRILVGEKFEALIN